MLIIWLQGLATASRYSFERTPLWAEDLMVPLTSGFLLTDPLRDSSQTGSATDCSRSWHVLAARPFALLMLLPTTSAMWGSPSVVL